jgi:hypothetical protein
MKFLKDDSHLWNEIGSASAPARFAVNWLRLQFRTANWVTDVAGPAAFGEALRKQRGSPLQKKSQRDSSSLALAVAEFMRQTAHAAFQMYLSNVG